MFGELRLAATLGGLAALLLGAKLYLSGVEQRGYARCQAEHTAAALEAAQEAQRLTRIAQDKNAEVTRGLQQKLAKADSNARARELDINRLRIAIDEASSGAGIEGDAAARLDAYAERSAVLGQLLGEAAGLAEEGRRGIERLAAQTTALQTYVSEVCVTK